MDKCLPFGAAISRSHFQQFSDAVAHIVRHRTGSPLINYLDNYFFTALTFLLCNHQIQCFLDVCSKIKFPVSMEKTVWATTVLTFLGFLINAEDHTISIPMDKVQCAMDQIKFILSKKKTTIHAMQKLTGFLNFLCRCIVPGRVFTRRLYAHVSPKMKPHHHLSVNREIRLDLQTWQMFLQHPSIFCRPFIDFSEITHPDTLNWFTDSSGKIGC